MGCSGTHPLLSQLPSLLVLRVPQQLHHSLLIRRETGDFTNDVADEDLLLAVVGKGKRRPRVDGTSEGGVFGWVAK